MKVAVVHERLNVMAGAEKHLLATLEAYPDAPVYTALYTPETMPDEFRSKMIHTSFAQKLPIAAKHHQKFLPLFMFAFEQFDLSEYDVVISLNHACAKSVITPPRTLHICLCLSPMRYAWDMYHQYIKDSGGGRLFKTMAALMMSSIRNWDVRTANGVDIFVANSNHVAARIRKYYRRDSVVIYPPVETDRFNISPHVEDYFLIVSRFAPYKKVDLAIEAFNQTGLPLRIIGEGEQENKLRALAGKNIRFMGKLTDEEVAEAYSKCRALIFPGEEDFGIVPVEAQAAGRPVIAFARGGACETVKDGVSGLFFDKQTTESLLGALERFEKTDFDPLKIRENAMQFDRKVYVQKLTQFVEHAYMEHTSGQL